MRDCIAVIVFFRSSISDVSAEIELSILFLAFTWAINWFDVSSIEADFLLIIDSILSRSPVTRNHELMNQRVMVLWDSKLSYSRLSSSFSFLKFVILLRINLKKSVFTGKGKLSSTKFVFFYWNPEFPKLGWKSPDPYWLTLFLRVSIFQISCSFEKFEKFF